MVGLVIFNQTLVDPDRAPASEYATLKAMGYTDRCALRGIVVTLAT